MSTDLGMDDTDQQALRESFPGGINGFQVPENEHDPDIFALVDGIELDGIPMPEAAEQDMLALHADIPEPQEQVNSASKDMLRLQNIRARNREAQARYREKTKVCSSATALGSHSLLTLSLSGILHREFSVSEHITKNMNSVGMSQCRCV